MADKGEPMHVAPVKPGRLSVTYATFTDRATGLGGWVHHETVAPTDGSEPYEHGWVAVFPTDAPPVVERFGADGWKLDDGLLAGAAGGVRWDLRYEDDAPPLYTFPKLVWERHLLPGAQIVTSPSARFTGALDVGGERIEVDGRGGVACIEGHGNAQRWGWLHADLEDGGVLEIVTATARRPWMRGLRPLALVQLRRPGEPDWPRNPLLAAPRFQTILTRDGFSVSGRAGGHTLDVIVEIPPDRRVDLEYTDPDGATAVCTNSEVATAMIRFEDGGRTWEEVLPACAHAEVGRRDPV